MNKVIFYAWSFDKKDRKLIENLVKILIDKSGLDIGWEPLEIASYGEVLHQPPAWGVALGSTRGINDPEGMVIELPYPHYLEPSKDNQKYRKGAMESLVLLAEAMKNKTDSPKDETKAYVKTDEGHTIGSEDTDFIMDEPTAKYLKRIKDLVGGHAYLEKDGMKVEIK